MDGAGTTPYATTATTTQQPRLGWIRPDDAGEHRVVTIVSQNEPLKRTPGFRDQRVTAEGLRVCADLGRGEG